MLSVVVFIVTLLTTCYSDPINGSTLVVFGNVTRVIELDYTTWSIALEDVQSFLSGLVDEGAINAKDTVGGPGTTTWNISHGEMIPNDQVSNILFDWADPLSFDVYNIADKSAKNPFIANNQSIRFPFLAMGISNYQTTPMNLKLNTKDINNMEIHEYLNKTLYGLYDVAFIRMSGSWNIINSTCGYQVNSTVNNFNTNKDFMMVAIHINPTFSDIYERVCDFAQNEHIHGFGDGKDGKSQGGHIKYAYVNEINVDIWPIVQVYIVDIDAMDHTETMIKKIRV